MTKDEGTTDLQVTENGDVIGTGGGDRLAALNRIADSADGVKLEQDELVDVVSVDNDETAPFVPGADNEDAPLPVSGDAGDQETVDAELRRAAEEANLAPPPEVPPHAPAPEQKHRIKVNGKEFDLTTAELIARAQKVDQADIYLAEAARARQEALKPPAPSQEELDAESREEAVRLAQALQVGTPEEAAAAILELRKSRTPRGPTEADIARVTDDRLRFRQDSDWFKTEYADIFADPFLKKLALDRDGEQTRSGDGRPYRERYKEIGDTIRDWTGKFKGEAEKPAIVPAASLESRREAKAAAAKKAAPPAAAVKAPAGEADEKPESPSDVIASIAKARGGNQFMR